MQKLNSLLIILQVLLFSHITSPVSAQMAEDPLRPLRHLANQAYVSSKDMVLHGSEGHLHEVVDYGNHMIRRVEALLEAVEALDPETMLGKKNKIIASVKGMLDMAKKAVAFSEQNKSKLAMSAARKASFRAKQTRQRLEMIR
ncbi:hypothetical protein JYT92_00470 [bacterium AH-315-L15]|nr:hypothetical protein [bacterium AH-315-L15]